MSEMNKNPDIGLPAAAESTGDIVRKFTKVDYYFEDRFNLLLAFIRTSGPQKSQEILADPYVAQAIKTFRYKSNIYKLLQNQPRTEEGYLCSQLEFEIRAYLKNKFHLEKLTNP